MAERARVRSVRPGNSGMVSGCKATPGCIAYVGISYQTQALQAGLGYAALQNAKGQYVLPDRHVDRGRGGGVREEDPGQRHHLADLRAGRGGYPIINYEYAIVSTNQQSSSTAKNVRSVLEWAVNPKYGVRDARTCPRSTSSRCPTKVQAQSIKQILSIK